MKRYGWLVAAAFPVAIVTSAAWFGVFTFVNGYVVRALGYSNADWTRVTLWLSGGMLLWYPVSTEISALIGRRCTVSLGLAGAGLAYVGLAHAQSLTAIGLLLVVMGFPSSTQATAWSAYVAHAGDERPGQALALSAWVLNLVSAAMLILGGFVAHQGNYRLMFYLLAATCGLCAAAFYGLSGPLERQVRARPHQAHSTHVISVRNLTQTDLAGWLHGPMPVVILFGICAAPFAFHTMNQLFPNFARDLYGFTETRIALVVGLARIPSLMSLLILSHFIDRVNPVRWYGAALFFDGAAVAGIALAGGGYRAGMMYLLFYVFHGVVWCCALPAVDAGIEPRTRDSAFAVTCMAEIGAVFLVGVVHNRLLSIGMSLPFVFECCGTVCALSGMALFMYSLRRDRAGRFHETGRQGDFLKTS